MERSGEEIHSGMRSRGHPLSRELIQRRQASSSHDEIREPEEKSLTPETNRIRKCGNSASCEKGRIVESI